MGKGCSKESLVAFEPVSLLEDPAAVAQESDEAGVVVDIEPGATVPSVADVSALSFDVPDDQAKASANDQYCQIIPMINKIIEICNKLMKGEEIEKDSYVSLVDLLKGLFGFVGLADVLLDLAECSMIPLSAFGHSTVANVLLYATAMKICCIVGTTFVCLGASFFIVQAHLNAQKSTDKVKKLIGKAQKAMTKADGLMKSLRAMAFRGPADIEWALEKAGCIETHISCVDMWLKMAKEEINNSKWWKRVKWTAVVVSFGIVAALAVTAAHALTGGASTAVAGIWICVKIVGGSELFVTASIATLKFATAEDALSQMVKDVEVLESKLDTFKADFRSQTERIKASAVIIEGLELRA
jgi:hypothetical protein